MSVQIDTRSDIRDEKEFAILAQGAKKDDEGKPDYTLIDPILLDGLAKVMMYGAKKYGRNNWRLGLQRNRILAAAARHLFAIIGGEDIDSESGLPHIDHVSANCMFFAFFERRGRSDS